MSSEWQQRTFGDLVEFVAEKSKVENATIQKYISTENMEQNFGGVSLARTIPTSGSVTNFRATDTLFSNIRTYFKKVWQARFDGTCSNDVLVFRSKNSDLLHPDYLHQLCRWEKFTELSVRTSKGAKMPRGDKVALSQFQFGLPSLREQIAISEVLLGLDDRIALLRETNTTLEAIAQALFKSWFVDFDPVHANAAFLENGQAPSLPAEIQALFPSRLVESPQGLIPEGWEFKKFSDVIDKYIDNRGKTPPTVDEGIPLLEIKHLPENEISPSVNTDKKISQETYDTWFRAHPMKNDILMSTVGTIGRLSIMGNQRVAIAQNILGLRVGDVVAPEYMYYLMKDNKFKSDVNARLVITVQASIKRKDLNTIDVLVPSKAAQSLFIDTVSQLIEKQRKNDEQAQNLANLRDTLLPRLISGQLRLSEAEAALAEVG